MKYQRQVSVVGSWAKASELTAKRAKIVSETNPMPSSFTNKDGTPKVQDVCKVKFEGIDEPMNVSLNRATINGLVEAFGEDSVNWQNHVLTVTTEKVRVAGKAVTALYLVPDGFVKTDDDNGYAVIEKLNDTAAKASKVMNSDPEISDEDVPF